MELAIMWRQHAGTGDRVIQRRRIVREGRERICVEHRGATGLQHGEHPGSSLLAGSGTGSNEKCGVTDVVQQAVEIFLRGKRLNHDAG